MAIVKPFFGANWKMNHGPTATRHFLEAFLEAYAPRKDRTVVFFPPAVSLAAFRSAAERRPDLHMGAQDVYWEAAGAFTGAISAPLAADAGAGFALAGHSERRLIFGDGDAEVARKVEAIAAAGLTPVLCVGERLEERECGEVEAVVTRQFKAGVSRLGAAAAGIVLAYEPVWAIGTGRNASAEDANAVHALIRRLLVEWRGAAAARAVAIIYGGSVKPDNIEELLAAPEIDGVLVGGASLKPGDFAAICRAGR
jgi:triosephosphate isomerase